MISTLRISLMVVVLTLVSFYGIGFVSAAGGGNTGEGNSITNPLKSQTIGEFLFSIIDIILVFAVPVILVYIMYAGYLFVTAQGESGKITEARNALLYAVLGGVIVLGAKVIAEAIKGTVDALKL